MEGSGALSSATDGTSRDGDEPSRVVVDSFFGLRRRVPKAWGGLGTPVQVFFSGTETFEVMFGDPSASLALWTDVRGIDAIIDACMAAKVRAEISGADLQPKPPALAAVLDSTEVPW